MKRIGIAVLVAIAALATTPVVSGGETGPIRNFEVVKDLPSTMYAGSTYEAHYRFDSIADEPVPVTVLLSIEGPDIGLGEWFVSATLNGDRVDVSENRENAGNFTLSCEVGANSTNDVVIRVSSLPNVLPALYTFTMELWSGGVPGQVELAPGDANGDGKISSADALLILRHVVGLEPSLPGDGDANGDGKVTSADALRVLRVVVGLE